MLSGSVVVCWLQRYVKQFNYILFYQFYLTFCHFLVARILSSLPHKGWIRRVWSTNLSLQCRVRYHDLKTQTNLIHSCLHTFSILWLIKNVSKWNQQNSLLQQKENNNNLIFFPSRLKLFEIMKGFKNIKKIKSQIRSRRWSKQTKKNVTLK